MERLRKSSGPDGNMPAFDPAAWLSDATRYVNVRVGAEAIVAALETHDAWHPPAGAEEQRRELVRRLAATLRGDTPLFELTAALVAPYAATVYQHRKPADSYRARDGLAVARAQLITAMTALFSGGTAGDATGFDPWEGLAEWLWTHLVAWAAANMEHQLGQDTLRAATADEYRRLLDGHLRAAQGEALRERCAQLLLSYAQELAKVVVDALSLPGAPLKRLEQILGFRPVHHPADLLPPRRPDTWSALSPLLQGDHLTVMSSAHYQALREALYKNTFAQVEGNPWPTAQLMKGGVLGQAQLRPPAADGQALTPPDQLELWAKVMWQQREELSDLDADALDALSALWLNQARSVGDRAVADVDGLLAMRGIKPKGKGGGRRAGYEPEQRGEMLRALSHIQNLWINIAEIEVYEEAGGRRGRKPVRQTIQSRAFVITDRVGQMQMNGYMDVRKFIFRPGEVFAHFLLGPGHQTALLSAMALKYDPYRQTWEKRLARYLSWQWRTKARNSDYLRPYRVVTLLDAVGKEVYARRPTRTRERLEQALDTLQRDEVIAGWQYDRWDEAVMVRRGWAEEWLEATVLIEPPEVVKEQYRSLERQVPDQPRASLPEGSGERLRRRRQELGLNQLRAGEQLGISQAYFSLLERGKVPLSDVSPALRRRLRDWLENGPAPLHAADQATGEPT